MLLKFLSLLHTVAVRLLGATLRFDGMPAVAVSRLKTYKKPLLYALWHGSTLCCFYFYRDKKAGMFIDDSFKGAILGSMATALGFTTFTVSREIKNKRTVRGTIQLIKYLKEGHDGVIAIDGPTGPAHIAKPGIISIAKKADALIVPVQVRYHCAVSLFWRWDTYQVPLPFSRCTLTHGEPIKVSEMTDAHAEEQILALLCTRATPQ